MRNQLGDAHGAGPDGDRAEARHAELAVNVAGAAALFLLQTLEHRADPSTAPGA